MDAIAKRCDCPTHGLLASLPSLLDRWGIPVALEDGLLGGVAPQRQRPKGDRGREESLRDRRARVNDSTCFYMILANPQVQSHLLLWTLCGMGVAAAAPAAQRDICRRLSLGKWRRPTFGD